MNTNREEADFPTEKEYCVLETKVTPRVAVMVCREEAELKVTAETVNPVVTKHRLLHASPVTALPPIKSAGRRLASKPVESGIPSFGGAVVPDPETAGKVKTIFPPDGTLVDGLKVTVRIAD